MKAMSAWQFTIFRVIFGIYLSVHFFQLVPYANELFGSSGILSDPSANPTAGLFPNPFSLELEKGILTGIMLGLGFLALAYAAGFWRRGVAVVLWFAWTALFHRNNLIINPSIPYVGLLLILSSLVPVHEPLSFGERDREWAMPRWVYRAAWVLMALGYGFSGLTKLPSVSWRDGSAMKSLLMNPLARPGWIRDIMLELPDGILSLLTWGTLAVEILFVPLALWSRSRPWIWTAMFGMHLGILCVLDFADLSLGMLMIHLFTFDPQWLAPKTKGAEQVVLHFDGECLMCSNFIRFVAQEDAAELIKFRALTPSESAPESMLLERGGERLQRSAAFVAVMEALGGHWRLLGMMIRCLPRGLRDWGYEFVAARRYRWFGKAAVCELPSREVAARLAE